MPGTMLLVEEDLLLGSVRGIYGGSTVDQGNMIDFPAESDHMLLGGVQGVNAGAIVNMGDMVVVDEEMLKGYENQPWAGWHQVNAGNNNEIPQGARPPLPGDNMLMIDYEEDYGGDLVKALSSGVVMIPISIMRSVILGRIGDAKLGYSGIGLIDFLIFGQYKDLV